MKLINMIAIRFHIWNQKRLMEANMILSRDREYIDLATRAVTQATESASISQYREELEQTMMAIANPLKVSDFEV